MDTRVYYNINRKPKNINAIDAFVAELQSCKVDVMW